MPGATAPSDAERPSPKLVPPLRGQVASSPAQDSAPSPAPQEAPGNQGPAIRGPATRGPAIRGPATRDPALFLDFVQRECKPAVAALARNAFRVREEAGAVTLFFDRANANLIPMIKHSGNLKQLEDAAAKFFGHHRDLHFSVGSDPAIARQRQAEQEMEAAVRADPKVQFILERFGGSIVKCEPLNEVKES